MTASPDDDILYVRAGETPGWESVRVTRNGVYDDSHMWTEVDVMGCWGRRYVRAEEGGFLRDEDGCERTEKVYGNFRIERR